MKTSITLKSRLPHRVVYKLCSYLRGSLQESQDVSLRKGLLKLTEAKEQRFYFQSDKNQYFYKIKRSQRHRDGQQAQEKMLHISNY